LVVMSLALSQYELILATSFSVILQWVQLYFWAKPTRVVHTALWLQGVFTGVAIKFFLYAFILLGLFSLMPNHVEAVRSLSFIGVFIFAYLAPYWMFGLRHSASA